MDIDPTIFLAETIKITNTRRSAVDRLLLKQLQLQKNYSHCRWKWRQDLPLIRKTGDYPPSQLKMVSIVCFINLSISIVDWFHLESFQCRNTIAE
jgi:hypothetical protein